MTSFISAIETVSGIDGSLVRPKQGNLTFFGTNITISGDPSNNQLILTANSGGGSSVTFTGNFGTATPLSNILQITGPIPSAISTFCSGNSILISLTMAIDIDAILGTNEIYPIAPSSLKAKLGPQTNNGLLVGHGPSSAFSSIVLSDGQILIGSSGNDPIPSFITSSGNTVTITQGPGSINLDVLPWEAVTSSQVMSLNTAYTTMSNSTEVALSLPLAAPYGTIVKVIGVGSGGWKILTNGQTISFGAVTASSFLSSTHPKDGVELVCVISGSSWNVASLIGNINAL